MGTWLGVYLVVYLSSKVMNDKFGDKWNDAIVGSSLYAYISHYFWLSIISKILWIPTKLGIAIGTILCFILTEFLVFATYFMVKKGFSVVFKNCK